MLVRAIPRSLRITLAFALVTLGATALSIAPSAASPGSQLQLGSASVNQGQAFSTPVNANLTAGDTINAFELSLSFNPGVATVTSVTVLGSWSQLGAPTWNNTTGSIQAAAFQLGSCGPGACPLVSIAWSGSGSGSMTLGTSGSSLQGTNAGGGVTITGVTVTGGNISVAGPVTQAPPTNTTVPPTNTTVPATNTTAPATNTTMPATNTTVPTTTTTTVPATNTATGGAGIPPTATASPSASPVASTTTTPTAASTISAPSNLATPTATRTVPVAPATGGSGSTSNPVAVQPTPPRSVPTVAAELPRNSNVPAGAFIPLPPSTGDSFTTAELQTSGIRLAGYVLLLLGAGVGLSLVWSRPTSVNPLGNDGVATVDRYLDDQTEKGRFR